MTGIRKRGGLASRKKKKKAVRMIWFFNGAHAALVYDINRSEEYG